MDVAELAEALHQAGVDPDRYVLSPLLTEPYAWQSRPSGSVWLSHSLERWHVGTGGISPHYHATTTLCS